MKLRSSIPTELLTPEMKALNREDFMHVRCLLSERPDVLTGVCGHMLTCPHIKTDGEFIPLLVDLNIPVPNAAAYRRTSDMQRQVPGECLGQCLEGLEPSGLLAGSAVKLYPHKIPNGEDYHETERHEGLHMAYDLRLRADGWQERPACGFDYCMLHEIAAYLDENHDVDLGWIVSRVLQESGPQDHNVRGKYMEYYQVESTSDGLTHAKIFNILQVEELISMNKIPRREVSRLAFYSNTLDDFNAAFSNTYGLDPTQSELDIGFVVRQIEPFFSFMDYNFAAGLVSGAVDLVHERVTNPASRDFMHFRLVKTLADSGMNLYASELGQLVDNIRLFNSWTETLAGKFAMVGASPDFSQVTEKLQALYASYQQKVSDGWFKLFLKDLDWVGAQGDRLLSANVDLLRKKYSPFSAGKMDKMLARAAVGDYFHTYVAQKGWSYSSLEELCKVAE